MATISTLAFAFRQSLGTRISLGNSQQLVCAGLGYKSLAAFQGHPFQLDSLAPDSSYVLDPALFSLRMSELNIGADPAFAFSKLFAEFRQSLPGTGFYADVGDCAAGLMQTLDERILNDGSVSGCVASMNCFGFIDSEYDLSLPEQLFTTSAPYHWVEFSCFLTFEVDEDRPYAGHCVKVEAMLQLVCTGKRSFRLGACDVIQAVRYDHDEPDLTPRLSEDERAAALAERLGVSSDEALSILDIEPIAVTGHDDIVYRWAYYLENEISPELSERILSQHGALAFDVVDGDEHFSSLRFI